MTNWQELLDIAYVFLYVAACAIFLPLPSEAPMFLFPNLSRLTVLLASALGKGCGSYVVFATGHIVRDSKIFLKVLTFFKVQRWWQKLTEWSEKVMKSYGFLGFLLLMSIPGFPMRSAIYSVSVLKINAIQFSLGSAIGTVVRCLLVYGGYLLIF